MIAFSKEQLSEVMCKHAEKENGLHDLMEIMLESLMVAERGEFLREQEDRNKRNGYSLGHTYGHGRRLNRAAPEGLQKGDEDAWRDAGRGLGHCPDGQDGDGQEVLQPGDPKNQGDKTLFPFESA